MNLNWVQGAAGEMLSCFKKFGDHKEDVLTCLASQDPKTKATMAARGFGLVSADLNHWCRRIRMISGSFLYNG
jgi:hypothetical protein